METHLQRYRLLLLILIFLVLSLTAWATGANRLVDGAALRALVDDAGAWSFAVFLLAFSIGQLLRIPGPVFVAAAVLAYGRATGTAAAICGALASVTFSFILVRTIAGQPLTSVTNRVMRRLLRQIDRHPVLVVATLRLIFQTAPPLNYALPMTGVRFRDHLIGSALGLPIPIAAMALAFDWALQPHAGGASIP